MLVRSSIPEGIMPMITVAVSLTASFTPTTALFLRNIRMAIGMIMMPTIVMIIFMECISSECGFLYFFAFAESFST